MQFRKFCDPPGVIALLARDGLGPGHDLDCGALPLPDRQPQGLLRRMARRLDGKD